MTSTARRLNWGRRMCANGLSARYYGCPAMQRFEILMRTAKPEDVLQALLSFMPETTKKQFLSVDIAT